MVALDGNDESGVIKVKVVVVALFVQETAPLIGEVENNDGSQVMGEANNTTVTFMMVVADKVDRPLENVVPG